MFFYLVKNILCFKKRQSKSWNFICRWPGGIWKYHLKKQNKKPKIYIFNSKISYFCSFNLFGKTENMNVGNEL